MEKLPSKIPQTNFEDFEPIIRLNNSDPNLKSAKVMNINIGVLGHIDSGKTSLCKALSTIASTAGFDKNPQSKERGITLDLGFSAFIIGIPSWFKEKHGDLVANFDYLQFTLVDCPGHASLMKTIIGGASIIDFMMLVVDSQKLIQTQTAECIVLGEILMDKLIIAMNKIDMFDKGVEDPQLQANTKKLRSRFKHTKFGAYLPIVHVAAAPKPQEGVEQKKDEVKEGEEEKIESFAPQGSHGVENLINTILMNIEIPNRETSAKNQPFQFAIDHCFQIKGQGTVMTGTVLGGQVKVGDTIEIPNLKLEKKVKSMQMFRKPVQIARQGDRLGICVTQLDADSIERGLACTPSSMKSCDTVLAAVEKIKFFTDQVMNKSKFHITLGHQTAIGLVHFFSCPKELTKFMFNKAKLKNISSKFDFDYGQEYDHEDQILGDALPTPKAPAKVPEEESKGGEQIVEASSTGDKMYFAIIQLEKQILIQEQSLVIASKLDKDISAKQCRLAFFGQVITLIKEPEVELPKINVVKPKIKLGKVDRINDPGNILIRELFQKETAPDVFMGLKVTLKLTGHTGQIVGTFGKSGKLKVRLDTDLPPEMIEDQTQILNTEVQLIYKKSIWQDKGKKAKNKFRFN